MWTSAFSIILGLIIGNFASQYFGDANYFVAYERSFFQATAIFVYVAMYKLFHK